MVRLRIADDAALAYVSAPRLELGLDQDHGFVKRGAAASTGPSSSVAEIKETSIDQQREFRLLPGCGSQGTRLKKARIGALQQANAGVVAQLHGDLAEAGIDSGDVRGAVLQQAVGKSAGGAPTSRQARPWTLICQCASAAASLRPPRLT